LEKRQQEMQEGARAALQKSEQDKKREHEKKTARLEEEARRMGMQRLLSQGRRLGTAEESGPVSRARDPNANRLGRLD